MAHLTQIFHISLLFICWYVDDVVTDHILFICTYINGKKLKVLPGSLWFLPEELKCTCFYHSARI